MLGSLWFNSFSSGAGGAAAYELISTSLISTNTPSVTFNVSSLSSTYKHLQVRVVARSASGNANVHMRFNSDSGSNYTYHQLYGTGSSVGSAADLAQNRIPAISNLPPSTTEFSPGIADILDPFSTTKNKTVRSFQGAANTGGITGVSIHSGAWYNTAALTSMLVFGDYDFAPGSRISLYGIRGS